MPKKTNRRSAADAAFERELAVIKNQMLRELQQDSQKLLLQLQQQFTVSLQQELARNLTAQRSTTQGAATSPLGTLSGLLGSALRLKFSKPSRSTSSQETERSTQTQSQFRLSRSQQLAELTGALGKGESNL